MIKTLFAILLAMLGATASGEEAKVSSLAIGVYRADDKEMLEPAFINAVNRYLRRYEPRLIERGAAHVKFMVNYDFEYAIELQVKEKEKEKEYEIIVTLHEKTTSHSRAQKKAAKLASGVHQTMENYLIRSVRAQG